MYKYTGSFTERLRLLAGLIILSGTCCFTSAHADISTYQLSNLAVDQCLEENNSDVTVGNCSASNAQQIWQYDDDEKSLTAASGLCIDGAVKDSAVILKTCDGKKEQKWKYEADKNRFKNDKSKQCLVLFDAAINGIVGVQKCKNDDHFLWVEYISPPPPVNLTNIRNLAYGQCISTGPDNTVLTVDCDLDAGDQKWVHDPASLALINSQGLCIDAPTPLALVTLTGCSSSTTQQWSYNDVTNNFVNAANGQCLDAWGGNLDTKIGVWTCDGNTRQQFVVYTGDTTSDPTAWSAMNLHFNGLAVAVDSVGKRLLYSLEDGYINPQSWTVDTFYDPDSPYTLQLQGEMLSNEGTNTLNGIAYGRSFSIQRYKDGVLDDVYTLIFTNLPIVQLSAEVITDEPKREGKFQISSGHYSISTDFINMGIEIRGATSQLYPKKSYGFQLGEDIDWTDEQNLQLLDMRKDGDWILDAAYRDTTFVRNLVNHNIYREIRPYVYIDDTGTPQGQSSIKGNQVEVILNGSYHGVYILSERVDRKLLDLAKVDVPEDENGNELWSEVDFSLPANGSVIYKADLAQASFLDASTYRLGFEQDYPDPDDIVRWEPLDELADLIINSSDSEFIAQVGETMDMDSLVNYWSLVLVGQARDNVKKNHFLARNESGKYSFITWDFDATFGMFWDGSPDDNVTWFFPTTSHKLFERLSNLPATGFNAQLKARWAELRNTIFTPDALAGRFQNYIDEANLGGARERNFQRWPDSGGEGAGITELGTSEYIRDLLVKRLNFVDSKINTLPEF